MTLVSTVQRNDYVGTGTTGPFAYTFKVFAATDLLVTTIDLSGNRTTLSYLTDYTVSGVGDGGGGNVTLTSALTSGWGLAVQRNAPFEQARSIRNQGAYYPATIEDALDELTMLALQLKDADARALHLDPSTNPATVSGLINPVTPGYWLRVKADGSGFETVRNTVSTTSALTLGSYLTGGSYDGSTPVTVNVDYASLIDYIFNGGGLQTLHVPGTTSGVMALAGDLYSHVFLAIGFDASGTNNRNPLNEPHQVGAYSAVQANAHANDPNGFVAAFESALGINAVSTVVPRIVSYSIGSIGVTGAGSSAGRTIGVMSVDETIGTSGNAFIASFTESLTFPGNWFIRYNGSRPSYLGGSLTVVSTLTTGDDVQLSSDGHGLMSSNNVRFISYTTANGLQFVPNFKPIIVANPSTRTTIGANGAATALTANPVGYLDVTIGATSAQIPYYTRGA